MTVFNVVRFQVKPGQEQPFIDEHQRMSPDIAGLRRFSLIHTGERRFCVVGEWDDMASLAAARPTMIAQLDRVRPLLEDLGGGLGVTDPVSGEVVAETPRR